SFLPLASAAFSQRGCSPRPLHDSPVEAFRYFAGTLAPPEDLAFADGTRAPRSAGVKPYSDISERTLSIASLRWCFLVCSICRSRSSFCASSSCNVATSISRRRFEFSEAGGFYAFNRTAAHIRRVGRRCRRTGNSPFAGQD